MINFGLTVVKSHSGVGRTVGRGLVETSIGMHHGNATVKPSLHMLT